MQIGSASLLALQQAQAKSAKPQAPGFDAALKAEGAETFEPLPFAQTAKPENATDSAPVAQENAASKAPVVFVPPGSQIDIKV